MIKDPFTNTGARNISHRFNEFILFHGMHFLEFAHVVERGLSEPSVLNLQMIVIL